MSHGTLNNVLLKSMSVSVNIAKSDADFRQFGELVGEYEESLPADLRHSAFASELADLHTHYGPPHFALIAGVGGVPAGCVALCEFDRTTAVVKKMYVSPGHRNLGIARALMTNLLELARARGYTRVVLDTNRNRLAAAYQLYRSLGFTDCEPYGAVEYACPTFMELRFAGES